jgi:HD-GYP domain-containing protein (c-di-GMP phosphodiesterase class II)
VLRAGAFVVVDGELTAIADVFSALIDKRAYKGSMRKEDALDLMTTFKGHLDMDLVREFRSFVLDGG